MSALLAFDGASVGYGDGPVLSGVDLTVAEGTFVGLVGPNGAGKSTLLRAVTGAARVTAGALEVCGRPAGSLSERERARIVGVVPQSLPAPFAFPAREFVEMGRSPHLSPFGGPGARDREIAERAMALTDTTRLADEPLDTLSGGDVQRLVLAQALTQEPKVLLLDEPVSHLDLNHRLQVLDLVRELADGGLGVLAVFHDLDLAARYSDVIAVVHAGGVSRPGPPAEVLTAESVSRVFGVRAVVAPDPVTGAVTVTPVLRSGALAPTRPERVFLACGAGTGAGLMRRLALAGFGVSAGGLTRGDTDRGVAEAVGARFVPLPAFGHADEAQSAEVGRLAADADVRVVCATPFGGANLGDLSAAVSGGSPLVLVGEMGPERDFTGGEASALWQRAVGEGALVVAGDEAAYAAVVRAVERAG